LVADLGVGRFALSVSDHELRNLANSRDRLLGLARGSPGSERINALGYELAGVTGSDPGL
jgi:hypothetical protein